jgi:spore germination protein YaaH
MALTIFKKKHTQDKDVPYVCLLCNCKAPTQAKWNKHVFTYAKHISASNTCKTKLSDSAYCHVSNRKFELDISPSGQLVPIDQPKNIPIDENVPDFTEEVTIEQVIVPENEDVFSLELEVNTLKETLFKERTEFERYISKMEKTKSTLNQELEKVKKTVEGQRKEDRKVKTTKEIRRETGARTEKKARGICIPGEKRGSPSTKKETINNL